MNGRVRDVSMEDGVNVLENRLKKMKLLWLFNYLEGMTLRSTNT